MRRLACWAPTRRDLASEELRCSSNSCFWADSCFNQSSSICQVSVRCLGGHVERDLMRAPGPFNRFAIDFTFGPVQPFGDLSAIPSLANADIPAARRCRDVRVLLDLT